MKITVIGAGTMGSGIAQVAAVSGHSVMLCDSVQGLATSSVQRIAEILSRLVAKGKLEPGQATAAQARLLATDDLTEAAACDLVIEAIKEDMPIKRTLWQQLDKLCPPATLFASNTSSLSITEMAAGLSRPLTGLHFFNPVPLMSLVEVIAGLQTSPETISAIQCVAESLGKTPIVVQESSGFVVNRILIPMINEAICVLAEGVASAADIDLAMKLGANHPIGPLALSDLVGNDVILAILETLQRDTGDPKYRPSPLLRKMVQGGLLGKKSGRGFFTY